MFEKLKRKIELDAGYQEYLADRSKKKEDREFFRDVIKCLPMPYACASDAYDTAGYLRKVLPMPYRWLVHVVRSAGHPDDPRSTYYVLAGRRPAWM